MQAPTATTARTLSPLELLYVEDDVSVTYGAEAPLPLGVEFGV